MTERRTRAATAAGVLMTMGAALLLVGALPAQAAPDCRSRLQFDEEYECRFVSDVSDEKVEGTLLFAEYDENAFQATLNLLEETTVGYCTCKTSPQARFDRSPFFECVTGFGDPAAETYEGKAAGNGRRILLGQLWSSDPADSGFLRFSFDCRNQNQPGDDDDDDDEGEDENEERVTVCHRGRTKDVSEGSLPGHLAHGDTLGPCETE